MFSVIPLQGYVSNFIEYYSRLGSKKLYKSSMYYLCNNLQKFYICAPIFKQLSFRCVTRNIKIARFALFNEQTSIENQSKFNAEYVNTGESRRKSGNKMAMIICIGNKMTNLAKAG